MKLITVGADFLGCGATFRGMPIARPLPERAKRAIAKIPAPFDTLVTLADLRSASLVEAGRPSDAEVVVALK